MITSPSRCSSRQASGLHLSRPRFYTGNGQIFEKDTPYIIRADKLPMRSSVRPGAVLVVVGDTMQLSFYKNRCCIIHVTDDADSIQRVQPRTRHLQPLRDARYRDSKHHQHHCCACSESSMSRRPYSEPISSSSTSTSESWQRPKTRRAPTSTSRTSEHLLASEDLAMQRRGATRSP